MYWFKGFAMITMFDEYKCLIVLWIQTIDWKTNELIVIYFVSWASMRVHVYFSCQIFTKISIIFPFSNCCLHVQPCVLEWLEEYIRTLPFYKQEKNSLNGKNAVATAITMYETMNEHFFFQRAKLCEPFSTTEKLTFVQSVCIGDNVLHFRYLCMCE